MFKSSNPVLRSDRFTRAVRTYPMTETMTVQGAVNKTGVLLLIVILSAAWIWRTFFTEGPAAVMPWVMIGVIGGLIAGIATSFKPTWAPITAPIYAVLEGFVLGGVSSMFETAYPGIASQAVALTFGVLIVLLLAYKTGVVRATARFKAGVIAATGAIFVVYMVSMVLGFFHVQVPFIFGSGPIGIIFSLAVVAIAALNLVLDFDLIESAARQGAPKYMEWYGAFALMVTLIWLYLEIIRLLAKLRDR